LATICFLAMANFLSHRCSSTAFVLLRTRKRMLCRSPVGSSVSFATREQPFSSSSSIQAFLDGADDENGVNRHLLTRTAVHRMRINDLRQQLALRKLPTHGKRQDLVVRLLQTFKHTEAADLPNETNETSIHSTELIVDPSKTYILQLKGLSPKPSDEGTGVGIVMFDPDVEQFRWTARKFLPSRNQRVFDAEYTALIMGLRYAIRRGVRKLKVQMDHDVLTKQIAGVYKVQSDTLRVLYWNVMGLKECLDTFDIQHISNVKNAKACELATKALATGKSINFDDDDQEDSIDEEIASEQEESIPQRCDQMNDSSIDPKKTYVLQFDGGARGNPSGCAGAGMVIFEDSQEVWCGWKYLDIMSNNNAEYWSLITGLLCAKSLGIRKIECQGDSELIVRQLNEIYRVRDRKLLELWKMTKEVMKDFDSVKITHIPRAENRRADWLANHAMDEKTTYGFDEE